jgi:hypothetical protein
MGCAPPADDNHTTDLNAAACGAALFVGTRSRPSVCATVPVPYARGPPQPADADQTWQQTQVATRKEKQEPGCSIFSRGIANGSCSAWTISSLLGDPPAVLLGQTLYSVVSPRVLPWRHHGRRSVDESVHASTGFVAFVEPLLRSACHPFEE